MEIKKISRKRIYEEIAEQLEDILLNNTLTPGDKFYSEKELAQMFEVSKATIRQALTVLEIKGLIERRKGDATYFSANPGIAVDNTPTGDEKQKINTDFIVTNMVQIMSKIPKNVLSEPMEVRKIIEPDMARLAAKRANEDDLQNIGKCLELQKTALANKGNFSVEADSQFHFSIAKAAKNSILLVLVETMHTLSYESREKAHLGGSGENSYAEHKRIFACIKAKDADGASNAMREHLTDVEKDILSFSQKAELEQ